MTLESIIFSIKNKLQKHHFLKRVIGELAPELDECRVV